MEVITRCACQLATVRFDNDAMENVYRLRDEVSIRRGIYHSIVGMSMCLMVLPSS